MDHERDPEQGREKVHDRDQDEAGDERAGGEHRRPMRRAHPRRLAHRPEAAGGELEILAAEEIGVRGEEGDRKSTRLNSSHANISYAVFCLKKKKKKIHTI